jgi:hypothetical protein
VWLYRLFPSVLNAVTVVQPKTIIQWHRAGFRLYWRWKSRSRGGRPLVPMEIRRLIRKMSLANRLWGAPRIHGELLKLEIEVAQSTVAKYMAKGGRGRPQTSKTFCTMRIGAMDFLVVPTFGFQLLFVLVILRPQRRRLISLSVTTNPTAEWMARQITDAFPWDEAPDYLIRDRDAGYGHAVQGVLPPWASVITAALVLELAAALQLVAVAARSLFASRAALLLCLVSAAVPRKHLLATTTALLVSVGLSPPATLSDQANQIDAELQRRRAQTFPLNMFSRSSPIPWAGPPATLATNVTTFLTERGKVDAAAR